MLSIESPLAQSPDTWTDYMGRTWPVIKSPYPLKFKNRSHAALRVHVFHRDGYVCVGCGARAIDVPEDYDGRFALQTDGFVGRWRALLVLDHILTRKAGGSHRVENLRAFCEACNIRKIPEDVAAAARARAATNA
jgi:5-methylcytosine-specific restriction endonuclease McrA